MADNNFENQTNSYEVHEAVTTVLTNEKKKKKKKRWIIIGIIALVIIVIAAIGGSGSDDKNPTESATGNSVSSDNTNKSSSIDAQKGNSTDDTLGDYVCTVKNAKLCKDWTGKNAVLITYSFTNNSSDAKSFDVALEDKVYQNGVGLETAILEDDTDTILDVEIKPGVTKDVKKAYLLRDTSTNLEVEISELFSFSDDKLTTTVKID